LSSDIHAIADKERTGAGILEGLKDRFACYSEGVYGKGKNVEGPFVVDEGRVKGTLLDEVNSSVL
jgi:hypothetical protein